MLRALIHKTAWLMDTDGAFSQSDKVSMCNYWANRLCCEAADRAMQVHGGLGYSRHKPFEHIYRHHRRYRITEGAEEIQMRRVAGYMFGFMSQQAPKGVDSVGGRGARPTTLRLRRPCSSLPRPPTSWRPSPACSTTSVLGAVAADLQHQVRVAGNLAAPPRAGVAGSVRPTRRRTGAARRSCSAPSRRRRPAGALAERIRRGDDTGSSAGHGRHWSRSPAVTWRSPSPATTAWEGA